MSPAVTTTWVAEAGHTILGVDLDSSSWYCPNARKLAELYDPQDSGLDMETLALEALQAIQSLGAKR